MNYFSSNLKYLREKNGMEQIDLAKRLGRKSSSSVSEWEQGKYSPKAGTLSDIATIFGVTLSDLMERDLSKELPSNLIEIKPNFIKVPILGKIACGEPLLVAENIEGYTYEPVDSIPSGNVFSLVAKGDSMEPTIPNGSIVLLREQSDVENGEIAAVQLNGDTEAVLKRVKKQGDSIFLISDNQKYMPIIVNEQNPARIIGKAISYKVQL